MRLLLARHGQSVWNQVRKFQGANDVGLSDLGHAQAEALGRALRGSYRVAVAYVSPMRRALDTAEIALAGTGIPLVPIPELRELSLGEWEGCTVDEIRAREGNPTSRGSGRRWIARRPAASRCRPSAPAFCTRSDGSARTIETGMMSSSSPTAG